jgi:type III secretory pathway component EscT
VNGPAFDTQSLCVGLLLCARMLPLALCAAQAGLRGATSAALVLVLAACLFPSAAAAAPALPGLSLALLALGARELLIGLVYAFALALPLAALAWSGRLTARLASAPAAENALAALQQWFGLAAFFSLGGQRVALAVLAHGLRARPLGQLAAFSSSAALALESARLFADAFATALLLALPAGAAVLLSDLGLAATARAANAPFVQPLLPPLRAALLLLVLCMALLLLGALLPDLFRHGLSGASRMLGAP